MRGHKINPLLYSKAGMYFFGNTIYKNVNFLVTPSCAQNGDQKKCFVKEGILGICHFVFPCTVDLEVLVYFGGFPDNLWTVILYWGADKSLARPGKKQATATNLCLLQTTQKKFGNLSVQPGLCCSNDLRIR